MAPEGAITANQDPEERTSTMVVIKLSEKVEGYGDNIYLTLCGVLYKEDDNSLFPLSGTYPYTKMNFSNCSKENNDWIIPGYKYNE